MDETGKKMRFSNREKHHKTGELTKRAKIRKFRTNNGLIELEKPLSEVSKKSCSLEGFKNYIMVKNEVNKKIGIVYSNTIFRKLKWYSFVEKRRYFDEMLRKSAYSLFFVVNHFDCQSLPNPIRKT